MTAGARAPRSQRGLVWHGGRWGSFQWTRCSIRATPQPYGFRGAGRRVIARAGDGVWIAPHRAPASHGPGHQRSARATCRRGGGSTTRRAGSVAAGPRRPTHASACSGWERRARVFGVSLDGSGARAFTPLSGLPSDLVLSVLARAEGTRWERRAVLAFLPADFSRRSRSGAGAGRRVGYSRAGVAGHRRHAMDRHRRAVLLLRTPGVDGQFVRPREAPGNATSQATGAGAGPRRHSRLRCAVRCRRRLRPARRRVARSVAGGGPGGRWATSRSSPPMRAPSGSAGRSGCSRSTATPGDRAPCVPGAIFLTRSPASCSMARGLDCHARRRRTRAARRGDGLIP